MGAIWTRRTPAVAAIFASLVLAVFASGASAASPPQAGTLDPSFGEGGQVTSALPPAFLYGTFGDLVEAPDGDLVVSLTQLGGDYIDVDTRYAIERRRADGSLDPSFDGDGSVELAGEATALAVDARGGVLYAIGDRVYRLNEDGSPDPGFVGEVPEAGELLIEGLAVEADGEVIVAGSVFEGSKNYVQSGVKLVRLSPQGALDRGFGRGGVAYLPDLLTGSRLTIDGLATLGDGSVLLLAAGAVRRFAPDGALDPGFGKDGVLDLFYKLHPLAMLAYPDGAMVLAGTDGEDLGFEPTAYLLRRYTPAGSPDRSFGAGGVARVDAAKFDHVVDLAAAPDGGIVLLGNSADSGSSTGTPVVIRLDRGGSRVADFGSDGVLAVESPRRSSELEPEEDSARAIVVSGAGRIAVAGTDGDATLAVRAGDGGLEPAFGAGASAIVEVGTGPSTTSAAGLVAEADGELLVSAFTGAYRHQSVAALLPFGGDGAQLSSVGGELHYLPLPLAGTMALYPGAVVADGPERLVFLARPPGSWCYLARLDRSGGPDRGFGFDGDGKVRLPDGFDARGLLVGDDHSLTVFGATDGKGMTVMRLTPRGRLDRRFGRHGLVHVSFGSYSTNAFAALPLPHGKLLIAGTGGADNGRVALVRLLPNGSLDPGFGRHGVVLRKVGFGSTARVIARQGGRILVGGFIHSHHHRSRAFVLRLSGNGRRLDRSFGRGGLVYAPDMKRPLAIYPSARGFVLVGDPAGGGVVLRGFDRQGRLDPGFGDGGTTRTGEPGGPFRFRPAAVTQQADGRIVVAGTLGRELRVGARIQLFRFL